MEAEEAEIHALSIPCDKLPMNTYIRGPVYKVMFERITIPKIKGVNTPMDNFIFGTQVWHCTINDGMTWHKKNADGRLLEVHLREIQQHLPWVFEGKRLIMNDSWLDKIYNMLEALREGPCVTVYNISS